MKKRARYMSDEAFNELVESLEQAIECEMSDDKEQTLEELLAGITEQNLHPEIQTGPPVGKEEW